MPSRASALAFVQAPVANITPNSSRVTTAFRRVALFMVLLSSLLGAASAQTLTTLVNFNQTNGQTPAAGLVQGTDGNFYGTTQRGGSTNQGTIFRMTPSGLRTTLVNFNIANGGYPTTALIQGTDGNFYGTTPQGGSSRGSAGCFPLDGCGTIFRMTPTGTLTTLVNFDGTAGRFPDAPLVQGSDGNFYGTTGEVGTVYRMTPAGTLTTLVNFNGSNGSSPSGGLVQGSDGNFYGTTYSGGLSNFGTVYRMTPTGILTTLANFNGSNGSYPAAGLVQGSDGDFYGTSSLNGGFGRGTVFRMTPTGTLTTLVNFDTTNGDNPFAALVEGSDGNFYSTTGAGGSPGFEGKGTVFRMTPAGTLTTLVIFLGPNGSRPTAELVQGNDGNFYSTTQSGGSSTSCSGGCGTVFSLDVDLAPATPTITDFTPTSGPPGTRVIIQGTNFNGATQVQFNTLVAKFIVSTPTIILATVPTGATTGPITITTAGGTTTSDSVFTVVGGPAITLVNFDTTKGSSPSGGLVQGMDGNFYGTTQYGGSSTNCSGGCGTVFRMTPAGMVTTLVNFDGINGNSPAASLVQGTDGNFYGTTAGGGSFGAGTVFRITPTGTLTTLVNFDDTNGSSPSSALVEGNDGNFYGVTRFGGSLNNGTAFRMTPSGTLTVLDNLEGAYSGLLQGSDGSFYGTTATGGNTGFGTVYRVTPSGIRTTLASFGNGKGIFPYAPLVEGSDGNFYGTTEKGGGSANCLNGCGTVFQVTPTGTLTTLVTFDGSNGGYPRAKLARLSDGNFYGTTSIGGNAKCPTGCGTVYRVTPSGVLHTLVKFDINNGRYPVAEVVQGSNGSVYGTTFNGGNSLNCFNGCGTVFRLNESQPAPVLSKTAGGKLDPNLRR
ncbi:choice-of-anchor tandem repeat GloVer-containing protein [Candidatus Cyanaurora vandensis]|uniref:choice-of-anchor tandem repeat GloVer-containing protein n=1 Tax=Candidatus Cyanaurora vandensis TaxID=2714958 RepID=UPI00257CDD4A|nr:choice-of-anchor tandem repeat GloVer-containing protein [Candidatus Cyanaurora vandensis]